MVVSGVIFGVATIRAGVLPRWTGATLIIGLLLMTIAVMLPDGAQTAAAAVRDLAFAGMGASLLGSLRARRLGWPRLRLETA
jgi:hypothetical protein